MSGIGDDVHPDAARALPDQARRDAENQKPPLKILLIEDSPEDRMAVRFALETEDFVLNEAENGRNGLALAKTLSPDAILLDYRLPDMDGVEILNALRRRNGNMPCAVVMLTGYTNGLTATKLLKSGALDYLNKQDLNRDSLRRAIHGSVDRFRLMEEHRELHLRNAQLAAIVTASDDAILCVGLDLVVQTWNPGAEIMFGYGEAEAIGRRLDDLILPQDSRHSWHDRYRAIVAEQKMVRIEAARHRKDGSLVPVEINAAPILDQTGKTIAISVTYRDIGDRKRVEEQGNRISDLSDEVGEKIVAPSCSLDFSAV